MDLVVYNTLTRRKEVFQPLAAGGSQSVSVGNSQGSAAPVAEEKPLVRMYVCGVTVYDLCHLGHARTYVVWDMVRRYLEWRGYRVKYVQNFTDVDDKILKRALERGESMQAVAERFIAEYFRGHGSPEHQAGRSLPEGNAIAASHVPVDPIFGAQRLCLPGTGSDSTPDRPVFPPASRDTSQRPPPLFSTLFTTLSASSRITASYPVENWRRWRREPVAG
jgi:hypothetical protein